MAICSNIDDIHNRHLVRFCSSKSTLRTLLSGVAPSLLLVLYEAIAMPHAFYRLAVIESQAVSSTLTLRGCMEDRSQPHHA